MELEEKLNDPGEFLGLLVEAIDFVANREGFSLILDINSSDIYFYTSEIDITERVLQYLLKNVGSS